MVETRLSDDAQTLLNMNHAVNTSSLCRDGKWLTEDDAIKFLNINKQTISLYRTGTACPLNIHVEHGQKRHAPEPYSRFLFLYITAEGTLAMKHSISLIDWSRMCSHFSNDDNIHTANNSSNTTANNGALFGHLFEKYTGVTATPYNIRRAIADGVIKQSADLQNVVPNNRKGRPKLLKSNNNTTRQQRKRNLADVLLPSTSKLTSIVVDRVTSLGSDKLIESDDDLSLIAGVMNLKKVEKIQFEAKDARGKTKQMIFSVCQVCNNHRVCEMRRNTSSHCRKCGLRQANKRRRDKNKQNNAVQAKKRRTPKKKLAKVATTAVPNSTPSEPVQSYEAMYNEAVEKHKMDALKLLKESAAKREESVSVAAIGEARKVNIAAMQRANASILMHNGKQDTSHRNDLEEVHAALSRAENDAVKLYIADAQKKKEEAASSK